MLKDMHKPELIIIAGPNGMYVDDVPEWAQIILPE